MSGCAKSSQLVAASGAESQTADYLACFIEPSARLEYRLKSFIGIVGFLRTTNNTRSNCMINYLYTAALNLFSGTSRRALAS